MKIQMAILITIVFWGSSFGQVSFPTLEDNPRWHLRVSNFGNMESCNCIIADERNICDVMYFSILSSCIWGDTLGYYRVDDQKVYIRNSQNCESEEYLLYDFGVEENDTFRIVVNLNNLNPDTFDLAIEEINYQNYFGDERKVIKSEYPEMTYIEGLGSTYHPFYPLVCMFGGCEIEYVVEEIYINDELKYDKDISTTIDIVNIKSHVKVFPNIVNESFVIEKSGDEELNIIIHDSFGLYQEEITLESKKIEVSVSGWEKGIYYIEILGGRRSRIVEKIIKI